MICLVSLSKVVTKIVSAYQLCLSCHFLLIVNHARKFAQVCNGCGRVWGMEYLYRKSVYLVAKK
jgi:hypothetical protein